MNNQIKFIAMYLPQFHPIPENNEWWGEGFTEWTNVTKAKPLFKGHYQPHIPRELGFYDLRSEEAREAQANLALHYGIHGFCYYHYWFNGRRLLERPFNDVLKTGKPDFPFCLCWANETWSRRWLGEEKEILIKQTYSERDDHDHIEWLSRAFADSRYIKILGRPVFLIYRPNDLPHPQRTVETFKKEASRYGLKEPYLIGVDAHNRKVGTDHRQLGFDGTMNFQPKLGVVPYAFVKKFKYKKLLRNIKMGVMRYKLSVCENSFVREKMSPQFTNQRSFYPSVFVGWDNSPRTGKNGIIMINSQPEYFKTALQERVNQMKSRPPEEQIVFINAWNEWAEGNHLEPDVKFGTSYLEKIKEVIAENN